MSNSGLLYTRQGLQNKLAATTKVTAKDCRSGEKCYFKNGLTDPSKKQNKTVLIHIFL